MRICWIEENAEMNKTEILQTLKQAIKVRFWEGESDPVFSLAYDREDQFFFKNIRAILWAKVFFEPVSQADLTSLEQEVSRLQRTFRQKTRILVMIPRSEENATFPSDFPSLCLEYFFFNAEGKKALGIRQIHEGSEVPVQAPLAAASPGIVESEILPGCRLSREELSGLIHLALDLKTRK